MHPVSNGMGEGWLDAAWQAAPDGVGTLKAVRDGDGMLCDFIWQSANPAARRFVTGAEPGRRLRRDDAGCAELFGVLAAAIATGSATRRTVWTAGGGWRVAAAPCAGAGDDGLVVTLAPAEVPAAADPVRAALDQSADSFTLFDAEDRLVDCTARLKDFFPELADALRAGATYESLLRRYAGLHPELDEAGVREAWVAARLEDHRRAEGNFTFRTPGGRWLLSSHRRTPDGGRLAIHTDVTTLMEQDARLRASEAEAREARADAEWASRAKSEFLAHMSHELRTPLNAILGFAEILASEAFGPLGSPRYRAYAKDIHDSGERLHGLIATMLDLARIEAQEMSFAEERIDLADAARGALAGFSTAAEQAGVALDADLPDGLPLLLADSRALGQMLRHLLSNAVKFTPRGGHIMLSGSVMPAGELAVMVADTGTGIAEDRMPQLFEPFTVTDSAIARRNHGAGVGLPVVKRMMELLGGRLELASEPGLGTTAILLFPHDRTLPRGKVLPATAARVTNAGTGTLM